FYVNHSASSIGQIAAYQGLICMAEQPNPAAIVQAAEGLGRIASACRDEAGQDTPGVVHVTEDRHATAGSTFQIYQSGVVEAKEFSHVMRSVKDELPRTFVGQRAADGYDVEPATTHVTGEHFPGIVDVAVHSQHAAILQVNQS